MYLALAQNYMGNVWGSSDLIQNAKNTLNTAMSIIILSAQPNKHTIMQFLLNIETTFEIRGKLSTLYLGNKMINLIQLKDSKLMAI